MSDWNSGFQYTKGVRQRLVAYGLGDACRHNVFEAFEEAGISLSVRVQEAPDDAYNNRHPSCGEVLRIDCM